MNSMSNKISQVAALAVLFLVSHIANAGAIFITGHDPDFHAQLNVGAQNINQAAITFIMDPSFNLAASGGATKFLFVESTIPTPGGHLVGKTGITTSGYVEGVDFDHHTAATLNAALNDLGSVYGGLVIASDFGGLLTQAELDILNSRSADIIDFLNIDNGGVYAMAESNFGAGLTPGGGHFGFLPLVVSTTGLNQSEAGTTVTAFGASLGLTNADVSSNFSHNIFDADFGLGIVDVDSAGQLLSLAGRGIVDPDFGIAVPEPGTLGLLAAGLLVLASTRRKKTASLHN
jgi:hypothetical protein